MPAHQEPAQIDEIGLEFLIGFGERLLKCSVLEEVLHQTVETTRKRLHSRTSSIFLFNKDGCLERQAISGLRAFGKEIYRRGEGLTGRTPGSPHAFGSIKEAHSIQDDSRLQDPTAQRYLKAYERALSKQLGFPEKVKQVITVPLDGSNRTFGVLRIVNRVDPKTGKASSKPFSAADKDWLTVISRLAANAVVAISRQERLQTIARTLRPVGNETAQEFLSRAAVALVSKRTAYSGCLIHQLDRDNRRLNLICQAGRFRPTLSLPPKRRTHRIYPPSSIEIGQGLAGSVFKTDQLRILPRLRDDSTDFLMPEWIKYNRFSTAICLPLRNPGGRMNFGTIQLFARYNYLFDKDEVTYLKSSAEQISAVLRTLQEQEDMRRTNNLIFELSQSSNIRALMSEAVRKIPRVLGFDKAVAAGRFGESKYFEVLSEPDESESGWHELALQVDEEFINLLAENTRVRFFTRFSHKQLPKQLGNLIKNARTLTLLPIPKIDRAFVGLIALINTRRSTLNRTTLRSFHKDLCQTLTHQISSLIRRNHSLEVLHTEHSRQAAIQRVMRTTGTPKSMDINKILSLFLQTLAQNLDANFGMVGLLSRHQASLEPIHLFGVQSTNKEEFALNPEHIPHAIKVYKMPPGGANASRERRIDYGVSHSEFGTEIVAPLSYGGQPLGVLSLIKSRPKPFDESDLSFIGTLADSISISIYNDRLHDAALKLGTVRFEPMETSRVCQVLAEKTCEIMNTPVACVWLEERTEEQRILKMESCAGTQVKDYSLFDMPDDGSSISWRVIHKAEERLARVPVKSTTSAEELHGVHGDIQEANSRYKHPHFATDNKLHSMIVMPMVIDRDVLGVINTYTRHPNEEFYAEEINLLRNLSLSSAIAISNTELTEDILNTKVKLEESNAALDREMDRVLNIAQIANPGIIALSFLHDLGHAMDRVNSLISSLIHLISPHNRSTAPGEIVIKDITDATEHLRDLFRGLVKLAAAKGSKYSKTDLREIFAFVLRIFAERLRTNNIEAQKPDFKDDDATTIQCDRRLIEQALINIFNNSIYAIKEHRKKDGEIRIEITSHGDNVQIMIWDNGAGIADDDLPNIFNPSFTTKGGQGTGFGLFICERIVKDRHKGKIFVKSRLREYTVVFISLPKVQE